MPIQSVKSQGILKSAWFWSRQCLDESLFSRLPAPRERYVVSNCFTYLIAAQWQISVKRGIKQNINVWHSMCL